MSRRTFVTRTALYLGVMAALNGCAHQASQNPERRVLAEPGPAPSTLRAAPATEQAAEQEFGQTSGEIMSMHKPGAKNSDTPSEPPRLYHGTGKFVKIKPLSAEQRSKLSGGEFTLNFEATDLQEVVKAILGDLLKENYFIDPKVTGSITIQTSRPLRKDELLPTLENLLRMNGAALVRSAGVYKVLPQSDAVKESNFSAAEQQQRQLPRGYGIRVIPLRYVSAKEIVKLIQPFAPTDAPPVVDEQRNLIVLAGTGQELANLADMIDTFDVDYLNGMSTGLFKLDNSQAKTMATELEKVFGEKDSPIAGMVKVVPIERLNSLMVIASRPSYLDHARDWIERLDKIVDSVEPRVYVYRVQNAKAKDLATVIGGLFGTKGEGQDSDAPPPSVAPGEEAGQLGMDSNNQNNNFNNQDGLGGSGSGFGSQAGGRSNIAGRQGVSQVVSTKNLKVMADESNNSLVVMASPSDYKMIEAALQRLDTVPLQVYIEASVVEVTLDDTLNFGLQWQLNQRNLGLDRALGSNSVRTNQGVAKLDFTGAALQAASTAALPGFSYVLSQLNGRDVGLALNALARASKANVLSSPSLMVLDNQTATIKAVTEVPVTTNTQQSILNNNVQTGNLGTFLGQVQYKEAGVILQVTPRVNSGGRITLELNQEVSALGPQEPPTNNRSFIRRKVQSTVTVQSGETIALGGLITEDKTNANSGVPFLKDVPVLGNLFKTTTDTTKRTELIIVMTPKAVRSEAESRRVTEEFKDRLRELNSTSAADYLRRNSGRNRDLNWKK